MKRSGLSDKDMFRVYISIVRPVMEYACPVWATSLTKEQQDTLESIQKRALHIICPSSSYNESLEYFNLPTLRERRNLLCKRFFDDMKKDNHKLHDLLPMARNASYKLRNACTLTRPKCKTNRYKNSFIPFSLFNFQ